MSCESSTCGKKPETIPYVIHTDVANKLEKQGKRWFIAFLITLSLFIGTNLAWIAYESQFYDVYVEQDGSELNNFNNGSQGNITNGTENNRKVP